MYIFQYFAEKGMVLGPLLEQHITQSWKIISIQNFHIFFGSDWSLRNHNLR